MERVVALPTFSPVQQRRSLDEIVEQIRESILTGQLPPGDRLPGERELCVAFGVSRPTLREALRVLEALGLVDIRRGRRGGIFAQEPPSELVADALESLARFSTASVRDLVDFRPSFEAENAAVAALHCEDHDLVALRRLADEYERASSAGLWQEMAATDVEFHKAVAAATRNQIRIAIMLAILQALRSTIESTDHRLSPDYLRLGVAGHIEIVEALSVRDPDEARAAMSSHVSRWREEVQIAGNRI